MSIPLTPTDVIHGRCIVDLFKKHGFVILVYGDIHDLPSLLKSIISFAQTVIS